MELRPIRERTSVENNRREIFRKSKLWLNLSGVIFVLLGFIGCDRNPNKEASDRLNSFLALTINHELVMYEKGIKAQITGSETFYMIEVSLQDNLLRGVYVIKNQVGDDSAGGRFQLRSSLERAKTILAAHPIRSVWALGDLGIEREFGELEAFLPGKVRAGELFISYFGRGSVRGFTL